MASIYSAEYQRFLVKLKNARLARGLTQQQVSKLLNKPQSFVSKCESGERRVDVIELLSFAKIYQRKLETFLE